jgi:hypothetical protein
MLSIALAMQTALLAWMRIISDLQAPRRDGGGAAEASQAAGMSVVQDVQIPVAVQQEIQ